MKSTKSFILLILTLTLTITTTTAKLTESEVEETLNALNLSGVNFIKGIITGASDNVDNNCLQNLDQVLPTIELDFAKLAKDLEKFDYEAIFTDLGIIFGDLQIKKSETNCHFINLYSKFQDISEILKAGYNIVQNYEKFKEICQAAIDAIEVSDGIGAGRDVGRILRLAFDYHTQ